MDRLKTFDTRYAPTPFAPLRGEGQDEGFPNKTELSVISVPSVSSVFSPPRPHRVTLANLHTRSITENIGHRRGERIRFENAERRRDRIQEAVHAKMREGLTYHQAWTAVKRQHTEWFRQD